MKRFLIFILIIMLSSIAFANSGISQKTISENGFNYFKSRDNYYEVKIDDSILDKSFVSWYCVFDQSPVVIEFGDECYCIDTRPNMEKKAFGYGNLLNCVKQNSTALIRAITNEDQIPLNFKLIVEYVEGVLEIQDPNIYSVDDSNKLNSKLYCNATVEGYEDVRFSFYRLFPFKILQRSSFPILDLSDFSSDLISQDEIRCRAHYYEGGMHKQTFDSINGVVLEDEFNFIVRNSYLAPAYPRVLENLYCYGSLDYNQEILSDSDLEIRHKYEFILDDTIIDTQTFNYEGSNSNASVLVPINSRGKNIVCNFTSIIYNTSSDSEIYRDYFISKPVSVVNSRPFNTLINVNRFKLPLYRRGNDIFKAYESESVVVAAITEKGDVQIRGNYNPLTCGVAAVDEDGEEIKHEDSVLIDVFGNFCGHIYKRQDCETGRWDESMRVFTFNDSSNNIVASINDDLNLCYTGYFFNCD